ncbi:MAG: ATP-binding protein, partial [Actinomycetota bacterium]
MREALVGLNKELERDWGVEIAIRTGVNTGRVVAGDPAAGQNLVTGDAVNVAARLEQAAEPGEILIGAETFGLVRDAVTVEAVSDLPLKGKAEAVPAFRLVEVAPGAPAHARRLDSPLVGRERERTLLEQAFERAISDRACHLFTVLGPAGVGKSRLVEEFLRKLGDGATVLRGRCLSYGEGITFWPVAEVVNGLADLSDLDPPEEVRRKIAVLLEEEEHAPLVAERVAQVLGLADAAAVPEETFWSIRKLLEAGARARPLVLLFDDVHWAEPTFLDLVEHIADWSRESPILLVCLSRAELLDHRPGWGGGKVNATSILLEPLTEDECASLIANLLGEVVLSGEARARITGAAEGNPLFVEEMLSMLIDDGLLRREDGRWVGAGDLSDVTVPPSIQAILAARLDRLSPEERAVIERASVVGKVFYRGAIQELSPEEERPGVGSHLMTLARKDLIRPDRSDLAGEDAFRFRHLLIRDAAYESMPKETRADLHERLAGWLERATGEHRTEFEEIVGYHLEQAYRYRSELGPVDDRDRALGARAAARLAAAGGRAHGRGDISATVKLLSRATEVLPGDPGRLELLPDLGAALS